MSIWLIASLGSVLLWAVILALPWYPWRNGEVFEISEQMADDRLDDVTVVIPARNEANTINLTLRAVSKQGPGLKVILVDDDSTDATAVVARQQGGSELEIIDSQPLPGGWSGKLWAQQQGIRRVTTPITLLLDADIRLKKGAIAGLRRKMRDDEIQFVSLMAAPHLQGFWEKFLMPAFVYFFKMLYPFKLANSTDSRIAAAAGGCIMMESHVFSEVGGLDPIKDALIDDCALAKLVKSKGYKTWTGLSHAASSQRPYAGLAEIWNMIARTAYTQLYYSTWLLLACTVIMSVLFCAPVLGILSTDPYIVVCSFAAMGFMIASYVPTLSFYQRPLLLSIALPGVALLYLMMTWTSAIRYWRGERSRWKGRVYVKGIDVASIAARVED